MHSRAEYRQCSRISQTEFEMDQCGSTRLERAKQNFFKVDTLKKEILYFRNILNNNSSPRSVRTSQHIHYCTYT